MNPSFDQTLHLPLAIHRSVLLTLGTQAEQVATLTETLSAHWLHIEQPPLALVTYHQPDVCESLVAACNQLSDVRQVQWLQQQGYVLKQRNEIFLWLVVDLNKNPETTQETVTVEQVAALLEECIQAVRAVLKVQLTVHALLLCEPQDQPLAVEWATGLLPACEDRLYLCGPVNQQHLRVDEWPMPAAQALSALLWSERSAPGLARWDEPSGCWVTAIGATGWRVPATEIQRWVAWAWLQQQIEKQEENRNKVSAPLVLRPIEAMERTLTTLVPPVAQLHNQPVRWLSYLQLATLPDQLQATTQSLVQRRIRQQRDVRGRWLETEFEQSLQQVALLQASSAEGRQPTLAERRQRVLLAKETLQQATDRLAQRLEEREQELEQQTERCREAHQALKEVCSQFPQPSFTGVLAALVTPWRWLRWGLLYLFTLPERTQHYLTMLIASEEMAWQQENLLAIRQLLLALIQSVQQQEEEIASFQRKLDDLYRLGLEQLASVSSASLQPWSEPQLHRLVDQVATTFAGWNQQAIPVEELSQTETSTLFERLWHQALQITSPILTWSPATMIEQALPNTLSRQHWLDQRWDEATPLWPGEELLPYEEATDWLLLPDGDIDVLLSAQRQEMQPGNCQFNGLLIVREVAVCLTR